MKLSNTKNDKLIAAAKDDEEQMIAAFDDDTAHAMVKELLASPAEIHRLQQQLLAMSFVYYASGQETPAEELAVAAKRVSDFSALGKLRRKEL